MPKTPSYRKRKGYSQALVTLTDSVTKRRRDYWLGKHGTPASRELYHRVIAAWEAAGRRLPDPEEFSPVRYSKVAPSVVPEAVGPTVAEVIRDYWLSAQNEQGPKRLSNIKVTLRLLRAHFGSEPATSFGPRRLRQLRDAMIVGDATPREDGRPTRRPWSRRTCNDRVGIVVGVFRWAAAQELVPASVPEGLSMLAPLKRGRTAAKEGRRIAPAEIDVVRKTLPFLSRQLRIVVELQLLTGARPGELLSMRAGDIDQAGPDGVWVFRPRTHKNEHRGHARSIFMGPRAQEILLPFLEDRGRDQFVFSPAEAEAERLRCKHAARVTPLSCGNRPGSNRRINPVTRPGVRYTTDTYRRAVERACDRAFPPPPPLGRRVGETEAAWRARLTPKQQAELTAWRKAHRWHPHQLRHNAATEIRRAFGLEAAQLALGHSSAQVTDAVYAERDMSKVAEIMRRVG
jgi:integrase